MYEFEIDLDEATALLAAGPSTLVFANKRLENTGSLAFSAIGGQLDSVEEVGGVVTISSQHGEFYIPVDSIRAIKLRRDGISFWGTSEKDAPRPLVQVNCDSVQAEFRRLGELRRKASTERERQAMLDVLDHMLAGRTISHCEISEVKVNTSDGEDLVDSVFLVMEDGTRVPVTHTYYDVEEEYTHIGGVDVTHP